MADCIIFYPCVSSLPNRVSSGGTVVREVADNDYKTFSTALSYTVNIRRNTAATKVSHLFVKSKGVASIRINRTPPLTRTVTNTVVNGSERSTIVHGYQHELWELPVTLYNTTVSLTFTGTDVRIYELMLLEAAYHFNIDGRFVRESHAKVALTDVLHQDPRGGLRRSQRVGTNRWAWHSQYSLLFEDDTYDAFLLWLERNPNVVISQGYETRPSRVYPAAVDKSQYTSVLRSDTKAAGSVVEMSFLESVSLQHQQITTQDNLEPARPLPAAVENLAGDTSTLGQITFTWDPPRNAIGAGIRRYEYRVSGGTTWTSTGTDRTFTIRNVQDRFYTYDVRAVGGSGEGISARVTIQGRPVPSPNAVRDLRVTAPAYNQLGIAFSEPDNVDDAEVSRYEYRIDSGSWVRIAKGSVTSYSVTLTGQTAGRKTVEVRAYGVKGYGASAIAAVNVSDRPVPSVVQSLTGTSPTFNRVVLSWAAPANATEAILSRYEYKVSTAQNWTSVGRNRSVTLNSIRGGTYTYQVRAVGATGAGAVASVSVTVRDRPLPSAVQSLTGTSPTFNRVVLSWTAPTNATESAVSRYEYKLSTAEGWTNVGTDLGVTLNNIRGGTLTYQVRAVGSTGGGAVASVEVMVEDRPVPTVVRSLTAASPTFNRVVLSWTAPENATDAAVTSYEYRAGTTGTWTDIGSGLTRTFNNIAGGDYTYQVRAVGFTGEGPYASATVTVSDRPVPAALGSFTATSPTFNRVVLRWTAPANATDAAVDTYQYKLSTETEWTDAGTALTVTLNNIDGGDYTYEVRAQGETGNSPVSDATVTVSNRPIPRRVRQLTFDGSRKGTITLSWLAPNNANAAAVSGYEYKEDTATEWETTPALSVTVRAPDTREYTFQVRAVGETGKSQVRSVTGNGQAYDAPGPIRNLVLTSPGDNNIRISLSPPTNRVDANVTHYQYKLSTQGDDAWTDFGDDTHTTQTVTFGGTFLAGDYTVDTRAVGTSGDGETVSGTVTVTTSIEAPGPPTFINTFLRGYNHVVINFGSPRDADDFDIQFIEYKDDSQTEWTRVAYYVLEESATYEVEFTDVTAGDRTWQARFVGLGGAGPPATSSPALTVEDVPPLPNVVRSVSINTAVYYQLTFTWQAPDNIDAARLQRYEWKFETDADDPANWRSVGTARTFTLRDLRDTTEKVYEIRAVGETGPGQAVGVTAAPLLRPVPDPVTSLAAAQSVAGATLSWVASNNATAANVLRYEYRRVIANEDADSVTWETNALSLTRELTLTPGSYTYRVRAVGEEGPSTEEAVTFTVSPLAVAVGSLAVDVSVGEQATLSWVAPTNAVAAGVSTYEYRVGTTGDWTDAGNVLTVTIADLSVIGDTTFQVRAVGNRGGGAVASVVGTVVSLGPKPPRDIRIAAPFGLGVITYFEWLPPDNADSFTLVRYETRIRVGSSWTRLSPNNVRARTGGSIGNYYTYYDTFTTNRRFRSGSTFEVKMIARGPGNTEIEGRAARVVWDGDSDTRNSPPEVSSVPIHIAASVTSHDAIEISWDRPANDGGSTIFEYEIVATNNRGTPEIDDDETVTQVHTVDDVSAVTFVETFATLTPGETYNFRLRSRNGAGYSSPSPPLPVTVPWDVPGAVQSLNASTATENAILLIFGAPANVERAGDVNYQYRLDEGDWESASSPPNATFIRNVPGGTYDLTVRAVNDEGEGPESTIQVAVRTAPPGNVRNLRHVDSVSTHWDIAWDAPENTALSPVTRYEYRVGSSGSWTDNGTSTTLRYTWQSSDDSVTLYVRAVGEAGAGNVRSIENASGSTVPAILTDLSATSTVQNTINASWTPPHNVPPVVLQRYECRLRSVSGAVNYTFNVAGGASAATFRTVAAGTYSLSITLLANGRHYNIGVSGIVVSGTPIPIAPANLSVASNSGGRVTIIWALPANISESELVRFEVQRTGQNTWQNAGTNYFYTFSGLRPNSDVTFSVRAVVAVGTGAEATLDVTVR